MSSVNQGAADRPPRSYLVLHHIAKNSNLSALLRSADAFGVHEVIVVGRRRMPTAPAVGMTRCVRRVPVLRLADAKAYLDARGVKLFGVEVEASAHRVETWPFDGDSAFLLGNEGDGLTDAHRAICDGFVRIAQHGHARSLNVNVAGAIVLHQFANWAGYAERPIEGQKFVPADGHAGQGAVDQPRVGDGGGSGEPGLK